MENQNKNLWLRSWGYMESFLVATALFLVGITLDFVTKSPLPLLHYPVNIIVFFSFILLLWGLYVLSKKQVRLKWLFSVPASISAITLFAILSLGIALVPQTQDFTNPIHSITRGWAYFLSYFYLLLTLGMTVVRKTIEHKNTSLGFIFNHLGLWLTLAAAAIGAGDRQKLTMYLKENETVWYALNDKGQSFELPFAIELNDFQMEVYPPKVGIINHITGDFVKSSGKPVVEEIQDKTSLKLGDYRFSIKEFYSLSWKMGNTFQPVNHIGAAPSAMILMEGADSTAWITCGSYILEPLALRINNEHSLVMLKPEAASYTSKITLYKSDGDILKESIEVNKPLKIGGWKAYQVSYDEKMGQWSETSVVELISDPWLPIVYSGCLLMIIGAMFLIYNGKKR